MGEGPTEGAGRGRQILAIYYYSWERLKVWSLGVSELLKYPRCPKTLKKLVARRGGTRL